MDYQHNEQVKDAENNRQPRCPCRLGALLLSGPQGSVLLIKNSAAAVVYAAKRMSP
jgi:hypothetical protein